MSQFDLLRFQTGEATFNTGWIPPVERTDEVTAACSMIQAVVPKFSALSFAVAELPKKVILNTLQAEAIKKFSQYIPANWLFETRIAGVAAKLFKNIQQNSGSCVGTRHTRYALDHTLFEAFFLNEMEKIVFPYTMYHYANGRAASGIRSKGEGSTGHGQAKAFENDGIIPYSFSGLPVPVIANEIEWTGQQEISYSVPSAFPASAFSEGRQHKFGSAVLVDSRNAVQMVLASGRSVAFCSDWGYTEGDLTAPIKDGLRYVSRRGATWNHCWGIDGYWLDHPTLGEIYHLCNNWGSAHGLDETTGDPFGFWVPGSVVDYILSSDETYAFLDLAGFPEELRKRSQFFDLTLS